jgi:hypothetical protein
VVKLRLEADLDLLVDWLAGLIETHATLGPDPGAKEADFHRVSIERLHAKRLGPESTRDVLGKGVGAGLVDPINGVVQQQSVDH